MAKAISKKQLSAPTIALLWIIFLSIVFIADFFYNNFQTKSSASANTAMEMAKLTSKLQMKEAIALRTFPAIHIDSRQTTFYKDDRGKFTPDELCRPLIVNTCGQTLQKLRVVWHMPIRHDNPLVEELTNVLELYEALEDLHVLDSSKAENKGNWSDITPSTLLPGESALITAFSKGVQQQIDKAGFAKGQLYVAADADNGLKLRMVYGFELEPCTSPREGILCRIAVLSDIGTEQVDPRR